MALPCAACLVVTFGGGRLVAPVSGLPSVFPRVAAAQPSSAAGAGPIGPADHADMTQIAHASALGGYWLSVELLGPRGAQVAAAEALALHPGVTAKTPTEGSFPPGDFVGHVATIESAMAWVAAAAFPPPLPGGSVSTPDSAAYAPLPGGDVLRDHRVLLVSLIVTGATASGGVREIHWPTDQAELLPPSSRWIAAALLPAATPLFAAPAPFTPAASTRYAMARRSGGLFVLDTLDRCDKDPPLGECLRWARVVVREGGRFRGGYLPNHQVARLGAWARGDAALPRAQLIPSRSVGDTVEFLLVARAADGNLHRKTLKIRRGADGEAPSMQIVGDEAVINLPDRPPLHIVLNADMDRRVREAISPP